MRCVHPFPYTTTEVRGVAVATSVSGETRESRETTATAELKLRPSAPDATKRRGSNRNLSVATARTRWRFHRLPGRDTPTKNATWYTTWRLYSGRRRFCKNPLAVRLTALRADRIRSILWKSTPFSSSSFLRYYSSPATSSSHLSERVAHRVVASSPHTATRHERIPGCLSLPAFAPSPRCPSRSSCLPPMSLVPVPATQCAGAGDFPSLRCYVGICVRSHRAR